MSKTETRVASNPGMGLPSAFASGPTDIAVPEPLFERTPYVSFVSFKGQAGAKLSALIADLDEGDPVLVNPEPTPPVKLSPFRFVLIKAWQHFSQVDSMGAILASTTDAEIAKADRSWKDHVETVLLVVNGKDVTCARCTFKTTKTNAAHNAVTALKRAEKPTEKISGAPAWATQGADYQATLEIPDARFRFLATVRVAGAKTGGKGFKYRSATSIITPMSIGDWQVIAAAMKDPKFNAKAQLVIDGYNSRVASVKEKMQ